MDTKLFIAIGFLAFFIITINVQAVTISQCQDLDTRNTYELDSDILNNASARCFDITENDVILDCQGHIVDGIKVTGDYGIWIERASSNATNITIKNCVFQQWSYSLYSDTETNNITIINSSFNDNVNSGLRFHGFNFSINVSTFNNNGGIGMYSFATDPNLNITNSTANNNGDAGFFFNGNTTILNCSASNNTYGIHMEQADNIVTGTHLYNNTHGIFFDTASTSLIYNNLFNNSNNVWIWNSYNSDWNTTNQTGNRIYSNGIYIGGNYWTDPDGSNFSDTCTDSNYDGFCDNIYDIFNDTTCTKGIDCSIHIDELALSNSYATDADLVDPVVTLNSPENNYNTSTTEITFNCSAFDNINLTSVSLYGNWSGGWHLNETNSSGINNTNYIFTKNISTDGIYTWNCEATDNSSRTAFATSNRTLIIDTLAPEITVHSPTDTIYDTLIIDLNVSDDGNVSVWWYNLNSGSNITFTPNTTITAQVGSNSLIVYANDTYGNIVFESVSFSVEISLINQSGLWFYINHFNDSLTIKNITFSSNVTYISIPKNVSLAYFANSNVTITGYQINDTAYKFDQNYSGFPQFPEGLESNDTNFFMLTDTLPGGANVSRYDSIFNYISSFSVTHDSAGIYTGLAHNGSHYFVAGGVDNELGRYDDSGSLETVYDISSEVTSLAGVDEYNNMLYAVDFGPDIIFEYHDNGTYTGFNFDVTSETTDPASVTFDGTNFYVLDQSDSNIYIYNSTGNYTNTFINLSALAPSDFDESNGLYFNRTQIYISGDTSGSSARVWKYDGLYPTNLTIDTGDDGINDFSMTGIFSYNQTIDLNSTAIIEYLISCTADTDGFCDVPLNATSDTEGILEYSDLNITYTFNFTIGFCGNQTDTLALIFRTYDEDSPIQSVTSDLGIEITVYNSSMNFYYNNSLNFYDNTTFEICMYPSTANFNANATIVYNADNYTQRTYYLIDAPISSDTNNINLYLLNDTRGNLVEFTIVDSTNTPLENIYLIILRDYVGNGTSRTVSIARTDFDGKGITYLVLNDVFYRFIIQDGNNVLDTTNPTFITSSSVTFQLDPSGIGEIYNIYDDIQAVLCSYSPVTELLTCEMTDTTGTSRTACLEVYEMVALGEIDICNTCGSGSSIALQCNVGNVTDRVLYYNFYISGSAFVLDAGYLGSLLSSAPFGLVGVLAAIFLMLFFSLGPKSPSLAIIGTVLGVALSGLFLLIDIFWGATATIAVAAGFVIYILRK